MKNYHYISVIGSIRVGKSTFINSFKRYFYKSYEKKESLQKSIFEKNESKNYFIELNPSDLIRSGWPLISNLKIILIDGYFGLEIELFEILSLITTTNTGKLAFIVNHLDFFQSWKALKKAKKRIKSKLKEVSGCFHQIFFFSGKTFNNFYLRSEVINLTRYIHQKPFNTIKTARSNNYYIIFKINFMKSYKKKKFFLIGYQHNCLKSYKPRNQLFYVHGFGLIKPSKIIFPEKSKYSGISFLKAKKKFVDQNSSSGLKKNPKKNLSIKFSIFLSEIKILLFCPKKKLKSFSQNKKDSIDSNLILSNHNGMISGYLPKTFSSIENPILSISENYLYKKELNSFPALNFLKHRLPPTRKNEKVRVILIECFNSDLNFIRNFNINNPLILFETPFKSSSNEILKAEIQRHKWFTGRTSSINLVFISSEILSYISAVYFCKEFSSRNKYFLEKKLKKTPKSQILFSGYQISNGKGLVGFSLKKGFWTNSKQLNCFSIMFTGRIINIIKNPQLFQLVKLKGKIHKKYGKKCSVNSMFKNNFQALRFVGATIKTRFKNKGIIITCEQSQHNGNFMAIFQYPVKIGQKVFLKIQSSIHFVPLFGIFNNFSEKHDEKEVSC